MKWSQIKLNKVYADWIMKSFDNIYNILEGGYRSGKTTTMILAFCLHLERMDRGGLHIAAGVDTPTASAILIEGGRGLGIKNYFGDRATEGHFFKKPALIVDLGPGKVHTIIITGHSKSNDYTRIRGLTADSVIATEATLIHRTFFSEMLGRTLESKYKKYFLDTNPGPYNHYVYTDYIDEWVANGANLARTSLMDNPGLTDEFIEETLRGIDPNSLFYKSMILGQRIGNDSPVYTLYHYNKSAEKVNPSDIKEYIITVDVGQTKSATTMVAVALLRDNTIRLIDHYYHRNGELDLSAPEFKTVNHYVLDTVNFCKRQQRNLGKAPAFVLTDHDPTFLSLLINAFKEAGLPHRNIDYVYKDKIINRIKLLSSLIYTGAFVIDPGNDKVEDALILASYDEKKMSAGKHERLDDVNLEFNPIDLVDAVEYAITYFNNNYEVIRI